MANLKRNKVDVAVRFEKMIGNDAKLFILFISDGSYYLYDTGTNQIMLCDKNTFNVLSLLQSKGLQAVLNAIDEDDDGSICDGAESIIRAICDWNVLIYDGTKAFFGDDEFESSAMLSKSNLKLLTLETTESCNLRCAYCIYDGQVHNMRNHGNNKMSIDVAKAAVDMLAFNSINTECPGISFYGGEPLLNVDIIKYVIDYTKVRIPNKNIRFAMTTNGTLIDDEIAEFIVGNNIYVCVSVDGPQEIHDRYRVNEAGDGSFLKTIKGVEILSTKWRDSGAANEIPIEISTVYAPPYMRNHYDQVRSLWERYPFLEGVRGRVTYPIAGSFPPDAYKDLSGQSDGDLHGSIIKDYFLNENKTAYTEFLGATLARVAKRTVTRDPQYHMYPHGCCSPGVRKLYVRTNGDISICDRIGDAAPFIGNVFTGIDYTALHYEYIETHLKNIYEMCHACWAHKLCPMCYTDIYDKQKVSKEKWHKGCQNKKQRIIKDLAIYTSIRSKNKQYADKLRNMQIM